MFKTIDQPTICEIIAIIQFLNTRNVRLYEIYGENEIREGIV